MIGLHPTAKVSEQLNRKCPPIETRVYNFQLELRPIGVLCFCSFLCLSAVSLCEINLCLVNLIWCLSLCYMTYPVDTGDCRESAANSRITATCKVDLLTVSAIFSISTMTSYSSVDDSCPSVGFVSIRDESSYWKYLDNVVYIDIIGIVSYRIGVMNIVCFWYTVSTCISKSSGITHSTRSSATAERQRISYTTHVFLGSFTDRAFHRAWNLFCSYIID